MNSLFKYLWLLWKIFCVILLALLVFSWPLKLFFDEYGISHPFLKNHENENVVTRYDIPGTYNAPGKNDKTLELFDSGVASTTHHFEVNSGGILIVGEWKKKGEFLFIRNKYIISEDINGKTISMDTDYEEMYTIQKNGDLAGSTKTSRGPKLVHEGVIRWKRIRR